MARGPPILLAGMTRQASCSVHLHFIESRHVTQRTLDNIAILCIRLGAFLCFTGWAWVHYYWEGPYGVLIWQEATFEFADSLGISWDEFVGTGANDGVVQKWLARIYWLYLALSILSLTVRRRAWLQMTTLVGGSGLLVILSYAKYLSAQRQLPMFIEHGGQMLIPILLVMALSIGVRHSVTIATAVVAFWMVFAGHGSYALDLWPTPATFYAMTSVVLHVDYETAVVIIRIAGILDFLVCVGIFIPYLRWPCLVYAVAWGFLTAIARPVAGMSTSLNYWGADQFIHEAVIRAPHFLIPLYLFIIWYRPSQVQSPEQDPETAVESNSATLPTVS